MEDLESLSRKELQAFAKQHGVKANQKSAAIIAALRLIQQDQGEEAEVTESLPAAPGAAGDNTEVVMLPVPTEEEMETEVGPSEEEVQEPTQDPVEEEMQEPAQEPAAEPVQVVVIPEPLMQEPVIPEPPVQEEEEEEQQQQQPPPAQPPSDGVEQEQDNEMDEDDKDVVEDAATEEDAVVTDSMETEVGVADDASDNMAAQVVTESTSAAQELPAVDPAVTGTGKGFTKSLKDRRSKVLQQRRLSASESVMSTSKMTSRPTPLPTAKATPASESSASLHFGNRTGNTPSSNGAPFVVKKSSKPLTEFKEFNLSAGGKKREGFSFKPHKGPLRTSSSSNTAESFAESLGARENRKPTPKRTPVKHTKLSAMREERIAKLKEGQRSARKSEIEARRA